ncbi:MAG: hypothetical protein KIS67_21845 [Verrucomicrobiae bacterium]|nr:hypothetical protein [Verrucomicrobiae bacterium]
MNPTREELLFSLVLTKPAVERIAWLDRECGEVMALRARLDALLAAHDQPDNLVPTQAEAARPTIKLDLADAPDEAVGQTLGRYRLLERVGEGGCGVVYVAEQTEPVRRRVALKVIRQGSFALGAVGVISEEPHSPLGPAPSSQRKPETHRRTSGNRRHLHSEPSAG